MSCESRIHWLKTSVRMAIMALWFAGNLAFAGSHSAQSGNTTVDTRGTSGVGSLEGAVYGGANRVPLVGASVAAGGSTGTSGSDGRFSIPSLPPGSYAVTVTASGYLPATVAGVQIAANQTKTLTVFLTEDSGNAVHPVVLSVESRYGDLFPTMSGQQVNNTYTAHVDWHGKQPASVLFDAPHQDIASACSPGQTLVAATFDNMGAAFGSSVLPLAFPLVVTARSSDGSESPPVTVYPRMFAVPEWLIGLPWCEIQFAVANGGWEFDMNAKFPNEMLEGRTTVPDWVPFIGGEFGLKKTQALLEGSFSSPESSGKFTAAATTGFKCGKIGEVGGEVGGGIEAVLGSDWSVSGLFIVGVEGTLSQDIGILKCLSFIPGVGAFALTPPGMWVDEHVFLYGEVSPAIEAELALLIIPKVEFQGAEISMECGLKAGVEVDAYPFRVNGYVGGTPYLVIQLPPDPDYFKEAAIDFVAGAHVRLFDATLFKAEGTWHLILIESASDKGLSVSSSPEGHWELAGSSVRVEHGLQPIRAKAGSSYNVLATAVPAKSGFGIAALSSAPFAPLSNTSASNLILNVYSESLPALAADGTSQLLVYGYDDPAKTNFQSTEIWYCWNNGAGWTVPAAVTDDNHLDCQAQLVFDDRGHGIAVWQRSHGIITNSSTLFEDMELAYAVFSPTSGTWSAPAFLSENNWLDHVPQLARGTNGVLMLAWIANEQNELVGMTNAPNRILTRKWDSTTMTWAPVQEALGTGMGSGVVSYSLAFSGSTGALVFAKDMDGVLTNSLDTELFSVSYDGAAFGLPQRLTDDAIPTADSFPKAMYSHDGHLFTVWIRGGALVMAQDLNVTAIRTVRDVGASAGLAGFSLASDPSDNLFVLWPDFANGHFDVRYRVYDRGFDAWGTDDGLLTDDMAAEKSICPIFTPDGTLVMTYSRTEMVYTNAEVTLTNGQVITVGNVPREGQTDIVLLRHSPGTDLKIAGLTLSPSNPAPGSVAQATILLRNHGDQARTNLQVALYDGEPAAGGTQIGATWSASGPVAPQATVSNTWSWVVPGTDSPHRLYAVADPGNQIDEYIEGNNTSSWPCVLADLAVVNAESHWIVGNRYALETRIANTGVVSCGTFDIQAHLGGPAGPVVASISVPGLTAGWTDSQTVEWDAAGTPLPTNIWITAVHTNGLWVDATPQNDGVALAVTPPTVGIAVAPGSLTAVPGPNRISLRWTDTVQGEDCFRILRRPAGISNWTETAFVPANICYGVDTNVTLGLDYIYKVFAANEHGPGPFSGEATAQALVDADGDGMPDGWEGQNFGNATNANAVSDYDGDGSPDAGEYAAGTCPTNPTSVFALGNFRSASSNAFVIQWSSVSNKFYTVVRTTNLLESAGVAPLVGTLPATPPLNTYTDRVDVLDRAFYRIGVEP